jgi:lipid-A-disaccharide synthase
MNLFLSAGEPSGDLHASNLIRSLQQIDPRSSFVGYGGEKMQSAGMELLVPMTQHAVMGFLRVIAKLATFKELLNQAKRFFQTQRPDAVLLIDFGGFNFELAKRAKAEGIPVYWFLPPQLWAWRGWRVRKVRRYVDHVLCALPFEYRWYRQRNVACSYVGHPYFDELSREQPDADFIREQRERGGRIVAILPGSRTQEVLKNAQSMLRSAEVIHRRRPDTRFLVAGFNENQAEMMRQLLPQIKAPVEVCSQRTPEIIRLAEACISVSGSVGLELMYSTVPTVVLYRVTQITRLMANLFIKCRYMSLVNLLADDELFPEFPVVYDPFEEMAEKVLHWLDHPEAMADARNQLQQLKDRYAQPGACDRAAELLTQMISAQAIRGAA